METKGNVTENMDQDILLIVDDDEVNRVILREIFQDAYQIEEAENGEEGLQFIQDKKERICGILLDVVMPVMNGMELLEKLKEKKLLDSLPIFLITAEISQNTIKNGYEMGVMDVITKPVVPYVVRRRVDSVIELFRSRKKMKALVESQRQKLLDKEVEIMKMNRGTIEALATAIEFRSGESGEHVRRISQITRYLLSDTPLGNGLSPSVLDLITMASILHDIGKIAIPDSILNKPGKLTPEEFNIMKTHTVQGAHLLERVHQLRKQEVFPYAYDIARHHHERWDGNGYPDRLRGNEISIWAQIVSLADVYDALVSKRVYKEAYGRSEAIKMIANGKCGAFNPVLLRYFFEAEKELKKFYD